MNPVEKAPNLAKLPAVLQRKTLTTHEKALRINLDAMIYGTFAEIGAGQEVARWFFRVGGAAGTVAKSMSAYDMNFSDAIYGASERYVSRGRVLTMLEHEYKLLIERLHAKRGADSSFFAFANTVAARSFKATTECHGWMGLRFQLRPNSPHNDIILHVRMLDRENVAQQEALGIVGVNFLYGAFYLSGDPEGMIESLLDGLSHDRIEVDMIKFSGPDFEKIDNRLMSLQLVKLQLTDAAMFAANKEVLQPSEILYRKPILVERGAFRPVTRLNLDMMSSARSQFCSDLGKDDAEIVEILEMTTSNVLASGQVDAEDFLARVDLICSMGKTVLISDFTHFHKLAAYLFRYSKEMVGIVVGIPLLREILDEKYYTDLEGGIVESFGRLFHNNLKLYVYPTRDKTTKEMITAEALVLPQKVKYLYQHLVFNSHVVGIPCLNIDLTAFSSRDVTKLIASADPKWEEMVVPSVSDAIKQRGLFGYKAA